MVQLCHFQPGDYSAEYSFEEEVFFASLIEAVKWLIEREFAGQIECCLGRDSLALCINDGRNMKSRLSYKIIPSTHILLRISLNRLRQTRYQKIRIFLQHLRLFFNSLRRESWRVRTSNPSVIRISGVNDVAFHTQTRWSVCVDIFLVLTSIWEQTLYIVPCCWIAECKFVGRYSDYGSVFLVELQDMEW